LLVDIEDAHVGLVSNGMDHDLQTQFVGAFDALSMTPSGSIWSNKSREYWARRCTLEEERRGGSQAAVRETF